MPAANPFLSAIPLKQLYVWVLAPHLETNDPNIDYYYDFSQSIAEYTKTFNELDVNWKWQPVTLHNYQRIIENIVTENSKDNKTHIVFNLCDGDEVNGTPGVSVIRLLEEKGLIYTGADEYFYQVTTSKIPMKQAFDAAGVPNAPWVAISQPNQDLGNLFAKLGSPLIVKPAVSGGSMGVGVRNVVSNPGELEQQVQQMFEGYRGWQLVSDGIVAESLSTAPNIPYSSPDRIIHPTKPVSTSPWKEFFTIPCRIKKSS